MVASEFRRAPWTRMPLALLAMVLVALGTPNPVDAQSLASWESFDFAHKRVDSAAVEKLPLDELRSLRGIVFGRHGRPFTDEPDVQAYLKTRPWYKADAAFKNSRLSATEKANVDVIRLAEAHKHANIETGDMRFYRSRVVTGAMLGHHTAGDWEVIGAEIGAFHGQRFAPDDPDEFDPDGNNELQKYFTDRYWYRVREDYTPKDLSAIERANADTIALARMRDLGYGVAPGVMYLFQSTPLTDSLLRGQTLYDLRLMRNEVYARHGRRFETPWLRDYFKDAAWYTARRTFTIAELSEVEKNNVKLIQAAENRRHEALSTREVGEHELEGLFPEVARRLRNEIFARHGRTFKDPRLQSYFASQDWYHANPKFDLEMLTPIERKNVATIQAYEAKAKTGQRFTEG
jgi:hypothetical protein